MQGTHKAGLLLCLALGSVVLGSWLCPVSRVWWDAADRALFFYLNGSLAAPSAWSQLWAILNSRIMDLVPLLLLLPFLLLPGLVIDRERRIAAGCHLLLILLLMLVIRTIFEDVTEALHWRGNSPTLTLEPAYRLSELYPALDPKDSSKKSFPGDHSGVLMIVGSFLLLQRLNRWSILAAGIAALFILPRLFAGAHWLSDVAVGGLFIASLSMAAGFFTPWSRQWADELAGRIYRHPLTPGWLR